jgi:hypothetical protein
MPKGYSKGGTIHKKKSSALKIAKSCRISGVRYRVVKLKKGYRVDKKY